MYAVGPCPEGEFEWIRSGREKLPAHTDLNRKGIPVACLIPRKFEAHAKILHGIDADYKNVDEPLAERENVILNIPKCEQLRSFVEALRQEGRGPRIRWRELAHLFGVPYQPEICHEWFRITMQEPGCWPRFLLGPGEGFLNSEELSEVIPILRAVTGNQDCFFRFSPIPFMHPEKPILFYGVLDELAQFLADGKYRFTPEYWWPSDRSWCLCTDYDLHFTFVGGPKELVATLIRHTTLEAFEVTLETRVDSYAPMPA